MSDFGETNDFSITGKGQNDLDDYVIALAKPNGWAVKGDEAPGAGGYYRSDHFNFAKVGVPALDLHNGASSVSKGEAFGKESAGKYTAERYHQPSDNYSDSMNTLGMAQTTDLMYKLGQQLGNETTFPGWKARSEFKAIRERSLNTNRAK